MEIREYKHLSAHNLAIVLCSRIRRHILILCNRGFSRDIIHLSVIALRVRTHEWHRRRIGDRGSTIGKRWFFSVKIYRTWHNSKWKDRLRRIIRRVIFHVNAQRELPPFGGMTHFRAELYLVRLSAHVGADVPQEFLVFDKRRRIMNPHELDQVVERVLDRELPLIVANGARGSDISQESV